MWDAGVQHELEVQRRVSGGDVECGGNEVVDQPEPGPGRGDAEVAGQCRDLLEAEREVDLRGRGSQPGCVPLKGQLEMPAKSPFTRLFVFLGMVRSADKPPSPFWGGWIETIP